MSAGAASSPHRSTQWEAASAGWSRSDEFIRTYCAQQKMINTVIAIADRLVWCEAYFRPSPK